MDPLYVNDNSRPLLIVSLTYIILNSNSKIIILTLFACAVNIINLNRGREFFTCARAKPRNTQKTDKIYTFVSFI
jgi:hypothetical protein